MRLVNLYLLATLTANVAHSAVCHDQAQTDAECNLASSRQALDCYPVPESQDQLCIAITESEYGPFHNVAFYLSDAAAKLTLLERVDDSVSTFHFDGFTSRGNLMTLVWADEGHPVFYFYRTQDFLRPAKGKDQLRPDALGYIAEYAFSHFDLVDDSGLVIYGLDEDMLGSKPDDCADVAAIKAVEDKQHCHRIIQLPLSQ